MGYTGWESFIDKKIREAMDNGEFDHLPGEGKPLSELEENPFEDADKRLAHHLLKNSGFTLPWIQMRQQINNDIERMTVPIQRVWSAVQHRLAFNSQDQQAQSYWQRAVEEFQERLVAINKQIDDYNLLVPADAFRMMPLLFERELHKITNKE